VEHTTVTCTKGHPKEIGKGQTERGSEVDEDDSLGRSERSNSRGEVRQKENLSKKGDGTRRPGGDIPGGRGGLKDSRTQQDGRAEDFGGESEKANYEDKVMIQAGRKQGYR